MEEYYEHTLLIPKRIVRTISNYMIHASVVYGIHLIGQDGKVDCGVLSIDLSTGVASRFASHADSTELMALGEVISSKLLPILSYERGGYA
jgi:hypothetical protein